VRQADAGLTDAGRSRLTEQGESFAQVLTRTGRVLDATPQLRSRPLLRAAELRRALEGSFTVERDGVVEQGDPTRLLATPVEAQGRRVVVVVGTSLDDDEEALASLRLLLLIGGPVALALALAAGYGVARAALRPAEAMRAQAEAISEHEPGQRLPVPPAHDEIAQLGATLNAMLTRLEAAFERERSLVDDASHELRTPLGS
jgi:two-component system, OmpR family, sensor kinase